MTGQPTHKPLPRTAGGKERSTSGTFLGLFRRSRANADSGPTRPPRAFPDQSWLVTFKRPNGDVATEVVLINGGNLLTDIETLARLALRDQRDIDCATIIRISIDHRTTPARAELLERIIRAHSARLSFEAECG